MRKFSLVLLVGVFVCIEGFAASDEFDAVKCGADVPKAMVGKYSSNERVVVLEARHSTLGLKDLGGIEISGRLFLVSWRVCGREYAELVNTQKHLVRDVLPLPAHSLLRPLSFAEHCRAAGKEIHGAVIAVLDNPQSQKPKEYFGEIMLPARLAWRIDEREERFVPMETQSLSCAVSGSSVDLAP